jgi:fermentation-respiration switch protein FrsA (DUF1100 family)
MRIAIEKPFLKSLAIRMAKLFAIVYLAIVALLMFFENSMIYPAPKYPVGDWDKIANVAEDVQFTADDGTKLHGLYLAQPNARGTLLFFHGNGENVSYLVDELAQLQREYQLSVFAFDYRGYGKSEGKPSERGIQLDARAALDYLNKKTTTEPADVIFFGRSIGGAIAVELASERGCKALVLQSTFSSLPDVAAHHYRWLPVRWLMRNRYPSAERIKKCPQPLLQTHGTSDHIVPISLARRLFDVSPSADKQFVEMTGGHNDPTTSAFWQAFERLLRRLGD